jgi:TonB family protein
MSITGNLATGTLVAGRYLVQEPLAGEGSSAVYRADDTRLDRAVALRALPAAETGGSQQGKAAARLVHPNVARVLDFGADAELGLEFVVADLGTGGSLAALLAQRGVPPLALATRMVQEAAAGMAAAHRAGLVHGDLHPGVLWLSRDEGRLRVQVLGLGLNPAGSAPPKSTARYASPERLRRARELSPASDVFSLGVMAYEVFAGLPADWNQLLLAMARGQAAVAPSLLEARTDLPAHVAHAVRRALAADPSSRWPDAGELAAHLIADLASQPQPQPAETPAAAQPVAVAVPAPAEAAAPAHQTADQAAEAFAASIVLGPDSESDAAGEASALDSEPAHMEAAAPEPAEAVESEPEVESAPAEAEAAPIEVAALAPDVFVASAAPFSEPEPALELEPVAAEAAPAESVPADPWSLEPVADPGPAPVSVDVIAMPPVGSTATVDATTQPSESAADAAPDAPATKPARQPLTAGRRGKPIALASTDLADTLYIPPTIDKGRRREEPAAASAEKPAEKPVENPAQVFVAAPPASVAAAPAAPAARVAETKPEPAHAPVIAAAPIVVPEPVAPTADETVPVLTVIASEPAAPAAESPAPISIPERRRTRGLATMGPASPGHRRGLLAASIVIAVIVVGGVVAKTVLAGGGGAQAPVANTLASAALASAGGAPAAGQPQAPAADSALPGAAAADSAAQPNPALTPEEQRKEAEERKRLEDQRRQQLRQQDSLRRVQLAAQTAAQPAAAVPQQVAVAPVQRPVESAPAPRLEQPAASVPAASAPAPAPERPRADPNRVYGGDELDTRPSLSNGSAFRSAVQRTYPGTLRGSGQWGRAVVSFVVLPDGRVDRSSVTVVEASQPAFRGAATAAIANARFNPARVDGQPVRAQVSMPITWQGGGRDDD